MKKSIVAKSILSSLLVTSFFTYSPNVNAQTDENSVPVTAAQDLPLEYPEANYSNLEDDLIITPMYIPIPYTYVHTKYYSNSQLNQLINYIKPVSSGINVAQKALSWASLPSKVARPVTAAGFIISNQVQSQLSHFTNAYNKGQGIQLIVRINPNYNGYNARTLAEWVPTYSPMW